MFVNRWLNHQERKENSSIRDFLPVIIFFEILIKYTFFFSQPLVVGWDQHLLICFILLVYLPLGIGSHLMRCLCLILLQQ